VEVGPTVEYLRTYFRTFESTKVLSYVIPRYEGNKYESTKVRKYFISYERMYGSTSGSTFEGLREHQLAAIQSTSLLAPLSPPLRVLAKLKS
jgi:predicted AAA+ superfamily ATPase